MQDELQVRLERMRIPEPSTGAAQRVVSRAKHMQQTPSLWVWLAQKRAWLKLPSVRYAVMAAVVLGVMATGWTSLLLHPSTPVPQQTAQVVDEMDLLIDITFDFEDWADSLAATELKEQENGKILQYPAISTG